MLLVDLSHEVAAEKRFTLHLRKGGEPGGGSLCRITKGESFEGELHPPGAVGKQPRERAGERLRHDGIPASQSFSGVFGIPSKKLVSSFTRESYFHTAGCQNCQPVKRHVGGLREGLAMKRNQLGQILSHVAGADNDFLVLGRVFLRHESRVWNFARSSLVESNGKCPYRPRAKLRHQAHDGAGIGA